MCVKNELPYCKLKTNRHSFNRESAIKLETKQFPKFNGI
jgi:hypothetical protein